MPPAWSSRGHSALTHVNRGSTRDHAKGDHESRHDVRAHLEHALDGTGSSTPESAGRRGRCPTKNPAERGFSKAVGLWIELDVDMVPGRGLEPPRSCPR